METLTNADKAIEVAVDWWADQLRGTPRFDNGDDSASGGIAMMLAIVDAANKPNADGLAVNKFKEILVGQIKEKFAEKAERGLEQRCILDVDYHPCMMLQDAMQEAGIKRSLPWKTVMWIGLDCVEVRAGYSAGIAKLWPSDHTNE